MTDLTLYQLSDAYQKLMDLDLSDEALTLALSSLEMSVEEKAKSIAHVTRNMQGVIDMIKNEENRLRDKRKAVENRLDKLKDYLLSNMENMNIRKIKTETDTIYIGSRKSSKITDMSLIPDDLKEAKVEWKADKRAITKKLKDGEKVKGAELKESKYLVIR